MKHAIVACAALLGLVALTAANNDFCLWPKRPDGMRPGAASAKYVDRYRRVKVGSKIYFDCPTGYSLGDGRHDFAICYSYGWYGLEVNWKKCIKRSRCDRRSAPDNGSVSKPKNRRYFVIGEKVSFSCRPGFRLEGSETDTCGKDGEWVINKTPRCEKIKCRPRPSLPNGAITPLKKYYYLDDEVTYTCDKRYVLIGKSKNKCGKDDKWLIKDNPTCVITCPDRSAPSKGSVKFSQRPLIPRTKLRFSCDDGYRLEGEKDDVCQKDGSWQVNKTPKCVLITCRKRNAPNKGSLSYSSTPLVPTVKVVFRCDKGYKLVGPGGDICLDGGKWKIGRDPKCELITCPKRMAPVPGSVTYSSEPIVPGVTLKFECKKGYLLSGRDDDVCEKDGSWKYGGTPKCKLITCPKRMAPDAGSVTYSSEPIVPGVTLKFECKKGYLLSGRDDDVCEKDGSWKYGGTPKCRLITCPERDAPDNGFFKISSKTIVPGTKIKFFCKPGFRLSGEDDDVCLGNGKWKINEPPKCTLITCPTRMAPDQGGFKISSKTIVPGTRIKFFCKPGYRLSGEDDDICLGNGKWKINKLPECILIECPARPAPSKGSVTYSRRPPLVPSTTLTFSCQDGYRLIGRKDDVCLGNGKWKYGQTVTCELILCPKRRAPKDGSITVVANPPGSPQYSPGAKLTFICDKGFDLKGYPFDKCQDDGTWRDNKMVECVPRKKKCGDIYGPDNGAIVGGGKDVYYSGDKVEFLCHKPYVIDVLKKDECQSNGKWKYADAHPPKFPVCRMPPGY